MINFAYFQVIITEKIYIENCYFAHFQGQINIAFNERYLLERFQVVIADKSLSPGLSVKGKKSTKGRLRNINRLTHKRQSQEKQDKNDN